MRPLDNSIAAMEGDLTEWRRWLHQRPETLYDLPVTSGFVAEKLRAFGFDEVHESIGRSGVVGVLHGGAATQGGQQEDKAILLRADMDALPMSEETGLPHASLHQGKMHACGHDGHTTMLLGAAKRLAETRSFDGTVIFCFQPAEEGGAGAKAMIDDGLFDRWPVRACYGAHNWPGIPVGEMVVQTGPVTAIADEFSIEITGAGGHAAQAYLTRDPIPAMIALYQAFQTIVTRRVDPLQPVVLSTTMLHAGSAHNVVPGVATMAGTVRAYDDATHALIREEMRVKCAQISAAFGVEARIEFTDIPYPATFNDADRAAFAAGVAAELLGADAVTRDHPPAMGGEDFSFLGRARPSAFVLIGNGDSAPLHHPEYEFDDRNGPIGAAFWTRLVERELPRS